VSCIMRCEVRKIAVKRLIRDEKGQALVLALILLALGGLIIGPLLSYIDTGLTAGGVYEKKAGELYAADAGVEDAIWKIQHPGEAGYLPCNPGSEPRIYTITDVNDKSVNVTITYVSNITHSYLVESKTIGDGSTTEISAYIIGTSVYGDFSGITNHVVTSQGDIEEAKKVYLTPPSGPNGPAENYSGAWPTAADLCAWYLADVKNAPHYDSDTTIDLNGFSQSVGPLYVDGTLGIHNSKNTLAILTLTGTIYITGDTKICYNIPNNQEMTLDLNGYTIFVASNSTGSGNEALQIGDKCNIKGPGAIIAVGDIYFKPNSQVTTDPVFVMSVSGKTWLQPGGNIYGAIAGSVEVDLQPGTTLNYPGTGFGNINFPGCTAGRFVYSIASWEVNQP
jgi:hypothetical protein